MRNKGSASIKLTKKDLKLIRLSVLKDISGEINHPDFIEDLMDINTSPSSDIDAMTPDDIPADFSQASRTSSSARRYLLLLVIKTGDHMSNLFNYTDGVIENVDHMEQLLYKYGNAYIINYGGTYYAVSGVVDKEKGTLDVTDTFINKLEHTKFAKGKFVRFQNNYMGIGDIWLLWDIMKFAAMEYQELKINSLLTRERLAISGAGPSGDKMVKNIIEGLYSGQPVLNFDNVAMVERILRGASDKNGKISFENRIDKLIMSFKHVTSLLARDAMLKYNDSSEKKERVNVAETNMENIYVDNMLDLRLKYRLKADKQLKEVFGISINPILNPKATGEQLIKEMSKATEKGKDEQ